MGCLRCAHLQLSQLFIVCVHHMRSCLLKNLLLCFATRTSNLSTLEIVEIVCSLALQICTCFMYVHPTEASKQLLDRWVVSMVEYGAVLAGKGGRTDQDHFNVVLMKALSRCACVRVSINELVTLFFKEPYSLTSPII